MRIKNGNGKMDIMSLHDQPKMVCFYTSFQNLEHFIFVFECLGEAAHFLDYKSNLDPKNELFLTLMKLRLNKKDIELSYFFGVSETVVSRIFRTWLNFMYFQLSELKIWLSRGADLPRW